MTKITTIEELRNIIGDEIPGLEDKNIDHLDEYAIAYIQRSPFFILSTADENGRCDASPKGDAPGFVQVLDKNTLVIPDRPGNRLAYGHRNILANPGVGLIFCIPGTSETLRINGKAELESSESQLEELAARGKPAVLAIRVTVEECFFHCGKAFIRSGLWKPKTWKEPHRVSFGEMYAARVNASTEVASSIDASIANDYETNL
jgi:PPOX class probable FMN-dependent enzyme